MRYPEADSSGGRPLQDAGNCGCWPGWQGGGVAGCPSLTQTRLFGMSAVCRVRARRWGRSSKHTATRPRAPGPGPLSGEGNSSENALSEERGGPPPPACSSAPQTRPTVRQARAQGLGLFPQNGDSCPSRICGEMTRFHKCLALEYVKAVTETQTVVCELGVRRTEKTERLQ